jgi:GSH-dependent disulfide-bond oxidoreductase
MIDLYSWTTPNGRKVSIMLEELGLPYTAHAIDLHKKEQFGEEFSKLSPTNRTPVIVDHDTSETVIESGAILIYLADKSGQFLPKDGAARLKVIEWLMWATSSGPILGQAHYFSHFNPDVSAVARKLFVAEAARFYHVLNRRLAGRDYVAGEYSIADIALWPFVSRYAWQEADLHAYPEVLRWYKAIAERPAVIRGYHVPKRMHDIPIPD